MSRALIWILVVGALLLVLAAVTEAMTGASTPCRFASETACEPTGVPRYTPVEKRRRLGVPGSCPRNRYLLCEATLIPAK